MKICLLGEYSGNSDEGMRKVSFHFAEELIRVAKDGGYIINLDQYNRHRLFSSVIFYLTLFYSVFGISFKSFGLGKNVIVSFLTLDETRNFLTGAGDVEIVLSRENKLNVSRKLKYTLLMSDIGRLVVIGKVRMYG
jgi:hypothetical protein